MSIAQQALWTLAEIDPTSMAYNIAEAYRLTGPLDLRRLQQALDHLVARHPALRTGFGLVGESAAQIVHPTAALPIEVLDAADGGVAPDAMSSLDRIMPLLAPRARAPFELGCPPLMRVTCLRLSDTSHVLLAVVHHIVSDGWSQRLFWTQLGELYESLVRSGEVVEPDDVPTPSDHALGERAWLAGAEYAAQLAYWRDQLSGLEPLQLPFDRPRVSNWTDSGDVLRFGIEPALATRVKTLARRLRVTPFAVLLAVFHVLLRRLTGQAEFATGTATAGRSLRFERTFGYFANMLVLRADLTGDPTFLDLVARVMNTTLEALSRHAVPFARIVAAGTRMEAPVAGMNPIFQVAFALQNTPPGALCLPGIGVEPLPIDVGNAIFDLSMTINERDGAFWGRIHYRTTLFDRSTVARMADHYRALLADAIDRPDSPVSRLEMLGEHECRVLLRDWGCRAPIDHQPALIQAWFERQADRAPDATAIEAPLHAWSYRDVERQSNRIANSLIARGLGPEEAVAVCCDDRARAAVALLGVVKAGAWFVPIDPDLPPARIGSILSDAGCRVALVGQRQQALVAAASLAAVAPPAVLVLDDAVDADWLAVADARPDPAARGLAPAHLAYGIYTSGSTGQPKGVACFHRALCSRVADWIRAVDLGPGRRYLRLCSPGFDVSVLEVFAALGSGATLCIAPADALRPGQPLRDTLVDRRISHAHLSPGALAVLPLDRPFPDLAVVICGGETCPTELAADWAGRARLIHAYGPTEATLYASLHECDPDEPWAGPGPLPIGRPVSDTVIRLLDAEQHLVPVGVTGELCIGGGGVARGYLNRPELNRRQFVADPFASEGDGSAGPGRLYRTGDLARWLPDGRLQWLGRLDAQVKVRGYRIELSEVEVALAAIPGVREAVVMAPEAPDGQKRLIAFVCVESAAVDGLPVLDVDALRRRLAERLPSYMVPAPIRILSVMPYLPNRKVDRLALQRQATELIAADVSPETKAAPLTPDEQVVADIWAEVVGVRVTRGSDGFFDVGGHSLSATGVAARIARRFGIVFRIGDVFEVPTLSAMSALAASRAEARDVPELTTEFVFELPLERDR